MSKDAYYFPHDSNAKDDAKCVLMIEDLGMEGYGIYWMLIETLRDQADYTYPINLLPALARRYNTKHETVETVVKNYELFTVKDDIIFFSQSLINRMMPLEKRKEIARIAGLKSAEKRALKSSGCNDRSTDIQHAFNEGSTIREDNIRKDNIRKEVDKKDDNNRKKATAFVPPSVCEVSNYVKENRYSVDTQTFIDHYTSNGWMVGKSKMKDWKATVRNWSRRNPDSTTPQSQPLKIAL